MNLGERIRMLREKKYLKQEDFGKIFHLEQTTISSYERGISQPSIKTITDMARFFGVSVDYLVGNNHENIYEELADTKNYIQPGKTIEEQAEYLKHWFINQAHGIKKDDKC
ncbi:helix-turn-helix domain-containing protein [Carnobacterium gallinarum]|uniref:helix-turn-helix domain-containing protein n=1 Tax=Carnobacterium gallinarum TaxID=2749 RepID=UPI000551CD8F|nr:helix-turn-helix transcriptional regulator [Carnobacterium gallinarum]